MYENLVASTISLPFYYTTRKKLKINVEEAEPILTEAYNRGVRKFAVAPQYLGGNCEAFVGKVLEPYDRSELKLMTNFAYFDESLPETGKFEACLERSLKRLRTDYVDVLFLYADCLDDYYGEIPEGYDFQAQLDMASKAKAEGKVKNIGMIFNPHNIIYAKDAIANSGGVLDTVMPYWIPVDPSVKELVSDLHNSGVTVVGGGLVDAGVDVLSDEVLNKPNNVKGITASELSTYYFLKQPELDEVIFQLDSMDYMKAVLNVADNLDRFTREDIESYFCQVELLPPGPDNPIVVCANCGYCGPCPNNTPIRQIFNAHAYYTRYGLNEASKAVFNELVTKLGKSIDDNCERCENCKKKCTHANDIPNLHRAVERFFNNVA